MKTSMDARTRVVVGVSDSPTSTAALAWAHDLCQHNEWTLDVVTAWPGRGETMVHEVPGHHCAPRTRAVGALQAALTACGIELDGPTARVFIDNDDPVHALARHSKGAYLLVLGATRVDATRRPGFAPLSQVCRSHTACPVVVIEESDAAPLRIA